jgi:hypothetical protein
MDILNNMSKIAETHSKIALENRNLSQVSQSLKIVKQALEIKCFLEPKSGLDSNSDLILELLLESISARIERAACYRLYLDFCQKHGANPLSKSDFFDFLKQEKFQIVRNSSGFCIIPPNSGRGYTNIREVQSEFERRFKSARKTDSLPPNLQIDGVSGTITLD